MLITTTSASLCRVLGASRAPFSAQEYLFYQHETQLQAQERKNDEKNNNHTLPHPAGSSCRWCYGQPVTFFRTLDSAGSDSGQPGYSWDAANGRKKQRGVTTAKTGCRWSAAFGESVVQQEGRQDGLLEPMVFELKFIPFNRCLLALPAHPLVGCEESCRSCWNVSTLHYVSE